MKLNNRGISIIEIVLTFSLIMIMVIGMFSIIMNYKDKASISIKKLEMDTFKNTLTKDIQDDILKIGVKEINTGGECNSIKGLEKCINIVFNDGSNKAFGTSSINDEDRNSIENKFLYYDGEKYKLHDSLPEEIPEGRSLLDFQTIIIDDNNILSSDSTVLSDGTKVEIYSIDVYISHIDFEQDFGIHIVADNSKSLNDDDSINTNLLRLKVLSNPIIAATPTLDKTSDSVNESGLYVSKDTNSGKSTYYFRGNVENNYVSFAGFIWRIVRINEDGTIRIIMQDGINNNQIYKITSSWGDIKYMYYSNSDIKKTLDEWYEINLNFNKNYTAHIAPGEYCEQIKTKTTGTTVSAGNADVPVYTNYTPDFKCTEDANGYGIINTNIGLITYDEVIYAGGNHTNVNYKYYLYNNNSKGYWTMSPAGQQLAFATINSTRLIPSNVGNGFLIRPVINLKSDTLVKTVGSGTADDPYIIQVNESGSLIDDDIVINDNTLLGKIIQYPIIEKPATTSNASNKTTDASGLYVSKDTNSGKSTYYFRGIVDNNYVSFANKIWRIVRINEDRTIRIIMQDGINDNQIYKFTSSWGDIKYMYYSNSDIEEILDEWLYNNISYNDDYFKHITRSEYCEQIKTKTTSTTVSAGNADVPVYRSYTPDFKCTKDANGYGIINTSIGLITYDEVIYAGGNHTNANYEYYLYNNSSKGYWTMSPAGQQFAFTTVNSTRLMPSNVGNAYPIRPVINLKMDTIVTGTGSSDDPYVIAN